MCYILSSREKKAGHFVSLKGGLQNQVVCQEFWVIIGYSHQILHNQNAAVSQNSANFGQEVLTLLDLTPDFNLSST